MVVRPPCCPNRMSVSRRSPTMQIWSRISPNVSAILASMNSAGLPTTVGSLFVDPASGKACQNLLLICSTALSRLQGGTASCGICMRTRHLHGHDSSEGSSQELFRRWFPGVTRILSEIPSLPLGSSTRSCLSQRCCKEAGERPTLDGSNHCAIASPLLSVRQVRPRVQVGRDEMAAWVLADAQRGILDLVVVDVPVKAHHYCSHL